MTEGRRLPQDFIDQVKMRVDLIELVRETVKLKGSGATVYGLCPFHEDSTPSFAVSSVKGTYYCHGCHAGGDAIKWLQERQGAGFYDAVVLLAERAGMEVPKPEGSISASELKQRRERGAAMTALREAGSLYKYGLTRFPQAQAYLQGERGLTAQTIGEFGLGFVGSGIRNVLMSRVRDEEDLVAAGICRRTDSGHMVELLRHRIVVPVRDEGGRIVAFAGRGFGEAARPPKYLNSPETVAFQKGQVLFGLDLARKHIASSRSCVVVEGYFDVMALHQAADRRAVGCMGTHLSETAAARLWRDADCIYLAFDSDAAGARATLKSAEALLGRMSDTQQIRVVRMPEGQDPAEFVRANGGEGWRQALESSLGLADVLVETLSAGLDRDRPETVAPVAVAANEWIGRCKSCPYFGKALRAAFERRLGIEL